MQKKKMNVMILFVLPITPSKLNQTLMSKII
jgi:hypothetical protein